VKIVLLGVACGVLIAACGADYYDKAPPMPPPTSAPRSDPRSIDAGPPFTLGAGAPADVERAAQDLYAACTRNGDANACNQVGQLAASRTWGTKNAVQAARLFGLACDAGSPAGCENLAEAYEAGDGLPVDEQKAWSLRERACQGKRGFACLKLGTRYAVGQGDAPRDFRRAREYLAHACEEGGSDACQLTSVVAACQAHEKGDCAKLDAMKARLDATQAAPVRVDAGR
jgi:TPR repeat protein